MEKKDGVDKMAGDSDGDGKVVVKVEVMEVDEDAALDSTDEEDGARTLCCPSPASSGSIEMVDLADSDVEEESIPEVVAPRDSLVPLVQGDQTVFEDLRSSGAQEEPLDLSLPSGMAGLSLGHRGQLSVSLSLSLR